MNRYELLAGDPAMSISFAVVGERRDDPLIFLVRGDDGRHYAYEITTGRMALVDELDAKWRVDLLPASDDPMGWEPLPGSE